MHSLFITSLLWNFIGVYVVLMRYQDSPCRMVRTPRLGLASKYSERAPGQLWTSFVNPLV